MASTSPTDADMTHELDPRVGNVLVGLASDRQLVQRTDQVFLRNEVGDVYAVVVGGVEEPVDPDDWRWLPDPARVAERKSIEEVQSLPGFSVMGTDKPDLRFVPGPKPERPKGFLKWAHGAAPAAVVLSKAGAPNGTLARFGRLTDALGEVVRSLPRNPQSNPFHVYDLIAGRLIEIAYTPPLPTPGGEGAVYVCEDGIGVKIGHTTGPIAVRIASLQTGNPRLISVIATVSPAAETVERHLHKAFAKWSVSGEWFDRSHLLALAHGAGGWKCLLSEKLPPGEDWVITPFPGYS